MFKHFLVTQFNLRNFPMGIEGDDAWVNWTRDRIVYFKQFCLPSLINQSNRNFTWLIYFDENTPKEFNPLINELLTHTFIKVLYAAGFDGFMKNYMVDVKQLASDTKWIITSRIDNDDCFEKTAIDVIQNNFKELDEHLISLASGYTYDIKNSTLSHYYYPMSPFLSIIELAHKKEIKGVFFMEHCDWPALRLYIFKELLTNNKKATFILKKPYWLQVIHGANVSNTSDRGFPILKEKDLSPFGIHIISKKESITNLPKYFNYVRWKRYLKGFVFKSLKSGY